MNIAKACLATSGTLLKASLAVVCGKIVAMALGPADFAVFGQYFLLVTMLQSVACLGLANAHVVYFAKCGADDAEREYRREAYSLALVGGVSVGIAAAAALSFINHFVPQMPPFPIWLRSVLLVYCAVTPVVVAKIAELNTFGQLASQQMLGVSTSLVQMIFLLVLLFGNAMRPPEAASAYCAGFILIGLPLLVSKLRSGRSKVVALSRAWQHYGQFVLPSLSAPLIGSVATITAFNVVKASLLADEAGVWFALWRLAEAYHGIIIAIGATLFLPQLAKPGAPIKAVAVKLFLVMLFLYVPWVFALLCWPEKTISLVFSPEFSAHLPNLFAQVLGDICKIVCSTCILVYIGISRPRAIVAGEVIFGLLFVSLLAFGIQGQGIGRCLAIYATSYAILSSVMVLGVVFLLRKHAP